MTASSDIVIVGAGVIGCAVAYELTRRGASVKVVDDRPPGMGATQAAAGILAPYIEAREGGPLLELTSRSLGLFDAFVERVTSESGVAVPYQRTGTLDVALQPASIDGLTITADLLARRGIQARLLDSSAVQSEEPQLSRHAIGGLLIPTHGFVAAAELTRALITAASRHGAVRLEHDRVRRISRAGTDLVVETAKGSTPAASVVVAAGTWSGDILIEDVAPTVPAKPIRGQLLQLRWCGRPLTRVVWGERCYVVPWQDGTVLVGATVEDAGFDERATVAGVRELLEAACDLLPVTRTATFSAAKVGLRPGSPDELPVIGPSVVLPSLVYATCHYRNGILLAPLTAQLVADVVLQGTLDPMLELTTPQRFGRL